MAAFRWEIPARFNMGRDVADRHAGALALIEIGPSGETRELRFDEISASPTGWRTSSSRAASSAETASPSSSRRGTRRRWRTSPPGRRDDLGAAVHALRRGGAGVPPPEQRRERPGHRPRAASQAGEAARPAARSEDRPLRRWSRGRHARSARAARASLGSVPGGGDRCRGACADHLHQRHDRPAQGRVACAAGADRHTSPVSSTRTTASRSPATGSGRRRTGPGSAACSTW